jgi:hypothetical protein
MSKITLAAYLDGMKAATTASDLEAAIQVPFKHSYRGRTWSQISKARIEAGLAIVDKSPLARYIPRYGAGRRLEVCGETYRVGRGGNSTGVRYCWHYAGAWAMDMLRREGFSIRASHRLWDGGWNDYPHRSLKVVEAALAGLYPDPELNVLRRHERTAHGQPINYSIEKNDADRFDRRASRPCPCGGTLFDWGAGHSDGFDYINWHCIACPDVFTEYMTQKDLYALRQGSKAPTESVPA